MRLRGTWIPFERALDLANRERITELLYPLFVHNSGQRETQSGQIRSLDEKFYLIPPEESSNSRDSGIDLWPSYPGEYGASTSQDDNEPYRYITESYVSTSHYDNIPFESEDYLSLYGEDNLLLNETVFSRPFSSPALPATGFDRLVFDNCPFFQGDKKENAQTTRHRSNESNRSPETQDSTSTDSFSSEYEGSTVGPKQALLDRLMDYFYSIISNCPSTRSRYTSHGSTPAERSHETLHSGTQSSTAETSPTEQGGKHSRKRRADDNDDAGVNFRPLKVSKSNSHPNEVNLRLACPFFKKNPGKHQRGACTGPGWATVHRVKEHVYRNHALPVTCPRCNEEFANYRLKDLHIRANEQCEVKDQALVVEGMDSTQKELLRSRKRTDKYMSETDKWSVMYLILFPDANPTRLSSPSGPTVDDSLETEFSRYEQFLRRELPSHVQRQLELCIEERLNPIEESLRSQLIGIIRDAQIQLFNTYRSLRSSPGGEPVQNESVDTEGVAHMIDNESHQVEDELRMFSQPPLMDEFGSFDDFNGLLYDFSEIPPGSVDLDSGYWSVAQASENEKEPGFLGGEFGI
ncbi:hypothetical protein CGRA01v4_02305 [Colletotrichum graminicola]|nr:hypothetical protein CGRA01v4_02305 [Colletotrichum graminicola]